jgi:hypothetical protein
MAIWLFYSYIVTLYNQWSTDTISFQDMLVGSPESLPPTSDALKLHIERAHFQASVWKQANVVKPVLPFPITMGWSLDGARLIRLLMTLHGNLAFLQLHRNVIQPVEH